MTDTNQSYEPFHYIPKAIESSEWSIDHLNDLPEKQLSIVVKEFPESSTPSDSFEGSSSCNSTEPLSASLLPESEGPEVSKQSTVQQYWYSLARSEPDLPWMQIRHVVRLWGSLNFDAFQTAVDTVQRRHGCLRTTFHMIHSIWMQKIWPHSGKQLHIVDVPSLDEEYVACLLSHRASFNLEAEHGWSLTIYRLDKQNYLLSIVVHRVVCDSLSFSRLLEELSSSYAAEVQAHREISGIEPCISLFKGSVDDQLHHNKQSQCIETHLSEGRPAKLLYDIFQPSVLTGKTDVQHLPIQSSLLIRLQQYCSSEQISQHAALLAVFNATLLRLTGVEKATLGTFQTTEKIGHITERFASIPCLSTRIQDGDMFRNVARHMHTAILDIDTGQHDVFNEAVTQLLQNGGDLSRHPLAQTLFSTQSGPCQRFSLEELVAEPIYQSVTSPFDLEVRVVLDNDSRVSAVFSTDLYHARTISNMLMVFCGILEQALLEPDSAIGTVKLVTSDKDATPDTIDFQQASETEYPRDKSVVDIFREQVLRNPERIAIKDSINQLTYAQLHCESDRIARWLVSRSLAPETLVGVLATRSSQTIVAFLGILKAGLAYLPLDSTMPYGRMDTILSSVTGHKIVLVGDMIDVPFIEGNLEFIHIARLLTSTGDYNHVLPSPLATHLAYVMFTSGSTGKPKGVMIEHRGIIRLVKNSNMINYLPDGIIMAHLTSIGFDNSTWEIYSVLLNGGTVICIDREAVMDCAALSRVFHQEQIRASMLTPTLLKQYLVGGSGAVACLDVLFVQGEQADINDMFMAKRLSGGTVINAYGPTENTVTSTFYVLTDEQDCANGVPIGHILSNSGAYVMDFQQRLVPLGVIGELVLTGDGLARGYTDPEANVGRFITAVINDQPTRAYRTGDLVRRRPVDGQLEFFGRIDGQVKIRGNRVELGEIEHVIRSHDCVSEAVVVLQNSRLASFVTIRDIQPGSAEEAFVIETWLDHWDVETYTPMDNSQHLDIGRDFVGWTSMYDGTAIDKEEMNEWLDETVETILDGSGAGNVLEIGTGSGMILFNLGARFESYVGLDPSKRAVDYVKKAVKLLPDYMARVSMYKASATDLDQLEIKDTPEIAILNSVIQYFPSQDYLLRVLRSLIDMGVRKIFVGDVRSYALHKEFLVERALFIARKVSMTKYEFQSIMTDLEKAESELLLDPTFFTSLAGRLPNVSHVEILPKRVHATNELSAYRYAAVLHINHKLQVNGIEGIEWISFSDQKSLIRLLQSSCSSCIAVSGIPNNKTILAKTALDELNGNPQNYEDWLSNARAKANSCPSMSAVDIVAIAEQTGWRVELSFARQHLHRGGFDAIFHHQNSASRVKFDFPIEDHRGPYHALSSQPLRRQLRQRVKDQLQATLRDKLPNYMVPQIITFLDKMPTNQSSKIDRKALAVTPNHSRQQGESQAMSTQELQMQQLWSEVLEINSSLISANDHFFHLGGDSITAMRIVSEARKIGIKMAVMDLFQFPILHDLAKQYGHVWDELNAASPKMAPFALMATNIEALVKDIANRYHLDAATIVDIFPCTPLQEGLMFETMKRPGDYMRQAVIRLYEDISEPRLCRAWETVVRAKTILRTRIVQHNGSLLQVVLDESITWVNPSTSSLEAYLEADKQWSMDLGHQLARYALIRNETGLKWLVWTAHHSLYDSWSLNLIQDAVYQAYNNRSTELKPGPQFQEFIQHINSQDNEEMTRYWHNALADCKCAPFPPLPTSVSQPVADSTFQYHFSLSQSSSSDVTISNIIRAAWALVMGQMTNCDDVLFGITLYGRNAAVCGLDEMTAPTIATVPVRIQTKASQTCKAYLDAVQRQATDMIAFEQTGLQNIAKVNPDACKFQTQLVIQADDKAVSSCPFGVWQVGSEDSGFTTYALTVELWLKSDSIKANAVFDSRAIQPWLVQRLLERLERVTLQLMGINPVQNVSEIQILAPNDLEQIWKWNMTVPVSTSHDLDGLIFGTMSTPDALAVCAWDGEVTYKRLNELSISLADELGCLGVGPGVLVPLCFEKSMWTVVAIFGVVKAGGAFVLLDPSLPEQRLQEIMQQRDGNLILSSSRNNNLAIRLAANVVTVDTGLLSRARGNFIAHQKPSSSSMLYVIFTSGSTGIPKGVMISYGNLASALKHQLPLMGLSPQSKLFDFASYSFDVSISNVFTALVAGGCICIPNEDDCQNNLEKTIESLGVNALDLTPSVARLLSPASLTKVKSLTLGGESLHPSDIKQWWMRGDVVIRNAYGPSECTPTTIVNHDIGTVEEACQIGKGAGVVTWIVNPDDHNKLVAPGCVGELLLEGPLIGLGYLNDALKTASAFINDPVWLLQGCATQQGRNGRLYKTGDLVKYDEVGRLTYVGRKDTQVKIRGQRVELGEIESVLRYQKNVNDAIAILQHGEQQSIAAFVTTNEITAEEQLEQCSDDQQQVSFWEDQFDTDVYSSIEEIQLQNVGKDFVGWTSMIDGSKIKDSEMSEWLRDTIRTITNSGTYSHILEIGTGSGMVLFNLPTFESYTGLEPSEKAVAFTMKTASSIPEIADKVKVFKGTAVNISQLALYTSLCPELVVINSVTQYFPSQNYLLEVIKDIVQLGSVKTIFFGDVRSHALHREFLVARALHLEPFASKTQLRQLVENLQWSEPELLVDPGFFTGLVTRFPGQVYHVEILPKQVDCTNELSCYRYAAVVHLTSPQNFLEEIDNTAWVDFQLQGLDRPSLHNLVRDSEDHVAVFNIPNTKIRFEKAVIDLLDLPDETDFQHTWLSSVRQKAQCSGSLSAVELVEMAHQAGCKVHISWARQFSQRGALDAVFHHCRHDNCTVRFPTDHQDRKFNSLSNQPLQRQIKKKICAKLEDHLKAHLPAYMIPQTITILDRMPINKNGKVDRQALIRINQSQLIQIAKRLPTTRNEQEMQIIWATALGIEPQSIGLDDGFMQLGGNSLAAMKVVSMAREVGIHLKMADMFRHSTTTIQNLLQVQKEFCKDSFKMTAACLIAEIDRHDAQIASVQATSDKAAAPSPNSEQSFTVLLTGANGFIGTQILRQLLENGRVTRVIAIVRGETLSVARQKVIDAARKAQWWTSFHEEALEVWLGDLSLPQLGLSSQNWNRLRDGKTVDIVIHNGASVHFIKTYAALEKANVASTAEMLSVTAASPCMKFVYVSSARHQDPEEENEREVAQYLVSKSNGYGQTKFAAECLVKRAALRNDRNQFVVVSPGLVIGTPIEGIVSTDDWLWRLAAACIRVGAYNADFVDVWVPLSDVSATATTIVDTALNHPSQILTQVRGGMTLGDFWTTLVLTGYDLEAQDAERVNAAIREDIEKDKELHPLWALSDMLESLEENHGTWAPSWRGGSASSIRLRAAVQSSANFLSKISFLPFPKDDHTKEIATSVEAFTRSGR